jgi:16S rRNA (cytosine967-C5)-methyltransferase
VLAGIVNAADVDFGAGPDVQLWTHLHGTDSMYLSLLQRLA